MLRHTHVRFRFPPACGPLPSLTSHRRCHTDIVGLHLGAPSLLGKKGVKACAKPRLPFKQIT
jgi:hypothetical protein